MVLSVSTDLLVIKYLDASYTLFDQNGLYWRYFEKGVEKVSSTVSDNKLIARFLLTVFLNDFQKTGKELDFKVDPALNEPLSLEDVYMKKDLLLNIGYFSSCPTIYLKELEQFKGKVFATPILNPDTALQVVRFA